MKQQQEALRCCCGRSSSAVWEITAVYLLLLVHADTIHVNQKLLNNSTSTHQQHPSTAPINSTHQQHQQQLHCSALQSRA
jgi:hypothetical protein